MTLKLHTTNLSPFGQRAKLALRAKGLLESTELVETFGGTDALGELAPMRQIPILEHDGFVLPESQIIVDYLDDLVPAPAFLPETPEARATARLLARIADLYIAPHFLTLIAGMREDLRVDQRVIAFNALNKGLGFAEQYLAANTVYAASDSLSVADLALAPFLFYVPHLADWYGMGRFPNALKCSNYLSRAAKLDHIDKAFAEMETAYKARITSLKN
jgi:glutathione S-transferase